MRPSSTVLGYFGLPEDNADPFCILAILMILN